MRNTLHIVAFLLFCLSNPLFSQEKHYPAFMSDPNDFVEQVSMTTDRDIYFTKEDLFFEGHLESTYKAWSKIIYIELISYNGHVHYQAKYKVDDDNNINGSLKLPQGVTTGYYYLRAYTKWMRNYSPYNYNYKPLLIINSYDNKVLSVNKDYKAESTIDTIGVNEIQAETIRCKHSQSPNTHQLKINQEPAAYRSTSLVREELITPYVLGIKRKDEQFFDFQFLPEIDGISITGKITNDSIETDLDRATVFLSIIGDTPYSSVSYTDEWGKFYFNLDDSYGHREAMISISSQQGDRINFLIDNDFCKREVALPYISPLTLSQGQWEKLKTANINAQIERQLVSSKTEKHLSQIPKQGFYTKPTIEITLDDYIEMPSLKDYIYELIPTLSIRVKKDVPRIVIRSSDNIVKVKDYNALIIYDGLFINDVRSFLDVSPRKIERIEVLNQVYILGDNVFGGIVNVISKDKNIENLNLNDAGLFVDYMMLHEAVYHDRCPQALEQREMLNNNTVLWSTERSDTTKSILTPDREGAYLLISSSWENGKLVRKTTKVDVE